VEMVRCKTIPLEVPANTEIVIEGEILPDVLEPRLPFGEYPGCAWVTVDPDDAAVVEAAAAEAGLAARRCGVVGGDRLTVEGLIDLSLADLGAAAARGAA